MEIKDNNHEVKSDNEVSAVLRKYSNFDEQQFYNRYADEIEADLNRREQQSNNNNGTEENDSTREEQRHDRGNQVQSGQRTDDNSGSEGGKDSEGEVRNRDEGSDESEATSEEPGNGASGNVRKPKFSRRGRTAGRSNERQGDLAETGELTEEKKVLQDKVIGWLSDENIEWAEGKDLKEVIEHFGNILEPIAVMPPIVRKNVPSLDADYLYCGKAYMIDHQANHHPELDINEYVNIQAILDGYDDIKDLSDGGNMKIAFVKKLDKGYAVVVELSKENDKIVLHKTFFYRDGAGKRVPYKNKPSILEKWSEDGSTSISPADAQQPADTDNISALDHSSDSKGKDISDSVQENGDKSSKTKQSKSTAEEKPFNAVIEMLRKKFPDASMEALTAADRLLREQALPGERQKAIEAVAKALGLKVEWRDTMEKENGTFNPKARTITIARDSQHALANTFGHEVTHAVRNLSEADYKNLKDAVRRLYPSEKEYNEAVQAYGEVYTDLDFGVLLDFDALEEELIADNIGFMIGGRNDMTQEPASRMNHRVLWAIHDAMNKVRNALAKVLHIDSKKNGLLEALDSAKATIRETMANAQRIAKEKGQGLSNESDSTKQSLRTQDSAIRDALVERMRLSGMDVITDETGQRVLDLANGKVRLMGSRTNKKMKEIADVLSEHELSEQQKTVVDVYSGKTDNLQLEVSRNDGNRRIVIRQGNDNKAGTKNTKMRQSRYNSTST